MHTWQVFSTLSFSGSSLFSKWNRDFDVVIIDEAAQAVSSCNPLFYLFIVPSLYLYFFPSLLSCRHSKCGSVTVYIN